MGEMDSFERFWAAWPKRQAKKDARKAWAQLDPSPELVDQIIEALAWQRHQPSWRKDDGQFIPLPASWIRAERWEDEPPASLVKPARKYWADECEEMHGGACEKQWAHEMKKREIA